MAHLALPFAQVAGARVVGDREAQHVARHAPAGEQPRQVALAQGEVAVRVVEQVALPAPVSGPLVEVRGGARHELHEPARAVGALGPGIERGLLPDEGVDQGAIHLKTALRPPARQGIKNRGEVLLRPVGGLVAQQALGHLVAQPRQAGGLGDRQQGAGRRRVLPVGQRHEFPFRKVPEADVGQRRGPRAPWRRQQAAQRRGVATDGVEGHLEVKVEAVPGQEAVKREGKARGDREPAMGLRGIGGALVNPGRPIGAGRPVPGGGRAGGGQALEVFACPPGIVEPPGRQAGRPMGRGDPLARAFGDGAGQAQRLIGLAVVEPAGGYLTIGLVNFVAVEQALDLGLLQQPLGLGEVDAAHVMANPALEALHPAALGARQPLLGLIEIDGVQGQLGGEAAFRRDRAVRCCGAFGLSLAGKPVDPPGVRMVGVALQPTGQFLVFRSVVGRVEIALGQDMAEKHVVFELRDQRVGFAPGALALNGEDRPVALDIVVREPVGLRCPVQVGAVECSRRSGQDEQPEAQAEPQRQPQRPEAAIGDYETRSAHRSPTPTASKRMARLGGDRL